MSNETLNFSNKSQVGYNPDVYWIYTSIILLSDVSSLLIRLVLCIGMIKCQTKCHPFDVSCLVVANLSFSYGILSWIVESVIDNVNSIQLTSSLSFICYLINARQIFWILSNHSLVFLSFNRVYLIHQSLCNPTVVIKKTSTGFQRWGFSIVFHTVNFLILLAYHLTGYFTNAVVFTDWSKCWKSTKSDTYKQLNYIFRNLVPCLAIAVNYVLIVPIYLIWHLKQSREKKSIQGDIQAKKESQVLRLSILHFIYTFFQASSWLISTAVTEFILKKDGSYLSSSDPHTVTMFEMFFGTLNNEALIGVWWLELISWLYMILDSFNPLILIFLHKHLHRAIIEILVYWKCLVFRNPKALFIKDSQS